MRRFAYKERERHPWSIHAFKIIQTMPNRKPEEELVKGKAAIPEAHSEPNQKHLRWSSILDIALGSEYVSAIRLVYRNFLETHHTFTNCCTKI